MMRILAGLLLALLVACSVPLVASERQRLDLVSTALKATMDFGSCPAPCGLVVPIALPELNAWLDTENLVILVSTQLIAYTNDDDELAFVVAHELGHLFILAFICPSCTRSGSAGESVADRLAMAIMKNAGYDTRAALVLLRRFNRDFQWEDRGTHPTFAQRIAALEAFAKDRN